MQDQKISLAAYYVANNYFNEKFLEKIKAVQNFNHTELDSKEVAEKIWREFNKLNVNVVPYKTVNPWSKVIGYAKGNTIYVNTRKSDLSLLDRIENIFHEATHLIGFSHDGNRVTNYNLKTVPYLSANIFKNFIKEEYDIT